MEIETWAHHLRRRSFAAMVMMPVLGALRPPPVWAAEADHAIQEIADGLYAHFGHVALTSRENAGDIANIGVVIGRDAVAVVDSGGSVEIGRHVLAAVRQITPKPIRYVINTHEHPDHIFGNAAFQGATFVGLRWPRVFGQGDKLFPLDRETGRYGQGDTEALRG